MTNKVFQHSLHRELWQWLADNPEKNKAQWPQWIGNGGDVPVGALECFACECAMLQCHDCPLIWPENANGYKVCDGSLGLWLQWEIASDPQERTRLALLIKDLPVKDGVVTE